MRRSCLLISLLSFLSVAMPLSGLADPPKMVPDTRMPKGVWVSDQKDGTYINPVLNGDYSDPDVVRVGDDYYLTASSFTNIPGLPILHSKDLINWRLIGHALNHAVPEAHHLVPRRGGGVWAPSFRHHQGRFVIFYPDPDFGVYMVSATDPKGPWSAPVLVDRSKGAIDPAPFWDEDGQAYLVMAFAKSRAGFNNIIKLKKLNADATKTIDEGTVIIDGDKLPPVKTSQGMKKWLVTEGPKLYKRHNYYYIFAPSGSVKSGWQGVFRSKSITGPYEGRNVLDQGDTEMNGPHQGAWVETPAGESWFFHFQDTDSYGRRLMLQPMNWGRDGWPIIGTAQKGETFGKPVWRHKKPSLPHQPVSALPTSDSFEAGFHLGWQWSANPQSDWVDQTVKGRLRLKSVSSSANLWEAGNLLTQKLPGQEFKATVKLSLTPNLTGERAGLLVLGYDYGWIGLEQTADGQRLVHVMRPRANMGGQETVLTAPVKIDGPVWVRVEFKPMIVSEPMVDRPDFWPSMLRSTHAKLSFSYSTNGLDFSPIGQGMMSQPGRWVGTQIGLFAQAPSGTPSYVATRVGYADFDDFVIE